ncbi:MAG: beta strand repeat-containing protein [Pseudomonadota bacterium]
MVSIATGSISGSFADKNVGINKTVNLSGVALSDIDAGNYSVAGVGGVTGNITQANLTLSTSNVTKTYDGGLTALGTAVVTGGTLFAGDTLSGGTFAFIDKNVGLGNKTVTTTGVTVGDGVNFGNYNVSYADNITSTINPAALVLSGTRVYDGSTTVAGSVLTATGVAGETFTVTGSGDISNLASKDVQTGSLLTSVTGLALGTSGNGGLSSNYTALSTVGSSVSITQANLTLSGTRTYNGSTAVAGSVLTASGVAGETFTVTGAGDISNLISKDVQTGSLLTSVTGLALGTSGNGGLSTNYTALSTVGSSVSITQANLTLSASNVTKTYDGGLTALGTAVVAGGTLFAGDTLSGGTFAFTDKNVGLGNKTVTTTGVTVGDGVNFGNYNVSYADNTTSTINPYAVSMTGARAYDSTTIVDAGIFTLGPLVGTETLTLSGAGSVTSANAGTYSVAGGTLSLGTLALGDGINGGLASNYTFTGGTQTVDIGTAALAMLTANNASKTYGSILTFNGTEFVVSGLQGSDNISSVTLTSAGAVSTADVATYNIDAVPGSEIFSVGSASNYTISYNPGTLTVNPYIVSMTGTRAYDGTANMAAGIFTLGPLALGQTLNLSGSGIVADKNVANGKVVDTSGITLVDGTGLASNYTFTGGTQTADITQANLTLSASNVTKTYDGGLTALGTAVVAGGTLFAGDTLSGGTFAFTDKNVGLGNKTVTTTGVTVGDGVNLGNYNVSYVNNTTSTITQANLTLSTSNVTKTYDGGLTALGTAVVTGGTLFAGDTLSGGTFAFIDKNVGLGNKTVTTTGVTVGDGVNFGNYNVSYANNTTSTINPAALTLSGTRVYDGSTTVAGSVLTATGVAGETFTVTGTGDISNLASKDVQTGSLLTSVTGLALGTSGNGGLSSNYTALSTVGSSVSITPYAVSMTGARTYDATASAGAGIFTLGPLVGAETLTLSGSGIVSSANVGSYSVASATLSLNTLALGNGTGLASNYTFTGGTQTVDINPAGLTAAIIGTPTKQYDGTTAATLASTNYVLTGFIAGEGATVTQTAGTYYTDTTLTTPTQDVLAATTVGATLAPTDFTATGATLLSNYTLPTIASGAGAITPKPASVTANDVTITYGDALGAAGFTAVGLVSPDTIGSVTMTLPGAGTTPDVGVYTGATPSNAVFSVGLPSNYTITYAGGTLTVTPKQITLYAERTYDTTTIINASNIGAVNGITTGGITQKLSLTGTGSLLDKYADYNKPITLGTLTLGDGTLTANDLLANPKASNGKASNYILMDGQATINKATLTLTGLVAQNKVYDGTTAATILGTPVISNPLSGDNVTVTATGVGTFSSKNAGYSIPVTSGYTLGGADAANYKVQTSMQANILQKNISLSGTPVAASRVYDGTDLTSISGVTINGLIAGDAASLTGIFTSPNAGTNKLVSLALTGNDAVNYIFSYTGPSLYASITPRLLTYTGTPVANSRVYDGTTTTTISGISNITGLLGTDGAAVVGQFADKNVGTAKPVTLVVTGTASGNYALSQPGGLVANITPRALTLSGTPVALSRPYDGTVVALIGGATLNNVVAGDTVNLGGTFANPNVGTAKPVTLALTGKDKGNYSIASLPGGLTADITQRDLIVLADNASMMFGGSIPPLTYTVGGAGLAGPDTKDTVFSGLLAVNIAGVNPGFTAPITQGTLALTLVPGGNYFISSFVEGTMSVQ